MADGLYHPAINDSIALRMSVSARPDQYPTPELRAEVSVPRMMKMVGRIG